MYPRRAPQRIGEANPSPPRIPGAVRKHSRDGNAIGARSRDGRRPVDRPGHPQLCNGGDQYRSATAPAPTWASDQQSLATYIKDGLNGTISAAQYPEGGEGRITVVADEMAEDMADDMDDMDDGMADDMDEMTGEELPATGIESPVLFIIAIALVLAGLLLASLSRQLNAARRRKRLSI